MILNKQNPIDVVPHQWTPSLSKVDICSSVIVHVVGYDICIVRSLWYVGLLIWNIGATLQIITLLFTFLFDYCIYFADKMDIKYLVLICSFICYCKFVLSADNATIHKENQSTNTDKALHDLFAEKTSKPKGTEVSATTNNNFEGNRNNVSIMEGGDGATIDNVSFKPESTDKTNLTSAVDIQKVSDSSSHMQHENSSQYAEITSPSSNNITSTGKIVARKGVGTPTEEDVTSDESIYHNSNSMEESGLGKSTSTCACCPNITVNNNFNNETSKNACILCCKKAGDKSVSLSTNNMVNHYNNSLNISNALNKTHEENLNVVQSGKEKDNHSGSLLLNQTVQPISKNKKPLITYNPDKNITSHEQELAGGNAVKKPDYVVPVVAVILVIPLIIILAIVLYKKASDFWERRHYRRMDFLIDGMYNE